LKKEHFETKMITEQKCQSSHFTPEPIF